MKATTELRLYAILDSVSCTGAYEFFIRPGETTIGEHQGHFVFSRNEHRRRP